MKVSFFSRYLSPCQVPGLKMKIHFSLRTHYLPHKSYSVESVLSEIRRVTRDMWLLTHKTEQGVNVVGELFSTTMFNPHINVVSGFVELESVHVDFRPFANMFEKYLHINGRPPGTTCVKLRSTFSYDLQRFLGNLKYPVGWQARNPFPVIKHGIVMDNATAIILGVKWISLL